MSDLVASIISVLLVGLGFIIGILYKKKDSKSAIDRELEDAIKEANSKLDSATDSDLIDAVAKYGTIKQQENKDAK